MATTKVCGIETEYGIHSPGPEQNPIAASSVLVNAYAADVEQQIGWDFEDETPGNDARGFAREGSLAPMVETHLANTVLTNGARFYVDHAHPEYSSPECLTPLECLVYDKAGEEVLRRSMVAAALRIPDQPAPIVYKNNSDGKGNSYGCHENYMMDRAVPFAKVIEGVVPHFVSRTLFTGSGKVGVGDARARCRHGRLPDLAAGRVLRGDRRARDDAQATDRQHPRRAPRRPQALPAPARDRRRRQPVGDRHLPEGRHAPPSCWPWSRTTRARPVTSPSRTRCGPCTRCRPTSR